MVSVLVSVSSIHSILKDFYHIHFLTLMHRPQPFDSLSKIAFRYVLALLPTFTLTHPYGSSTHHGYYEFYH